MSKLAIARDKIREQIDTLEKAVILEGGKATWPQGVMDGLYIALATLKQVEDGDSN
jgi:hypothetical protein